MIFCQIRHCRRQRPTEQAICVISLIDLKSEGPVANNAISGSFLCFESDAVLQPISLLKDIHIYIYYLLSPWSRVLLEKLTGFAANQEIARI